MATAHVEEVRKNLRTLRVAYFQAATARVRIVAKRQDAGLLVEIRKCTNKNTCYVDLQQIVRYN